MRVGVYPLIGEEGLPLEAGKNSLPSRKAKMRNEGLKRKRNTWELGMWGSLGKEPLPPSKMSLVIGALGVLRQSGSQLEQPLTLCGPQISQRDDWLKGWSEKVRRACSRGYKARLERLSAYKNRHLAMWGGELANFIYQLLNKCC